MQCADDLLKSVTAFHATQIYQYLQIGHWIGFILKENEKPPFTLRKIICIKSSKCT